MTENEDEDDADPIENGWIDLGEVVAETLALDLDPYPRKPGEAFAEHIEEDDGAGRRNRPLPCWPSASRNDAAEAAAGFLK